MDEHFYNKQHIMHVVVNYSIKDKMIEKRVDIRRGRQLEDYLLLIKKCMSVGSL